MEDMEEYYEEEDEFNQAWYDEELDYDEEDDEYGDEVEEEETSKMDLADVFEKLLAEYPRSEALEGIELPVTVGEIREIFESMYHSHGGLHHAFLGANSDPATISDLQVLFRKVNENYEFEVKDLHLKPNQMTMLRNIFNKLAGHYS